MAPPIQAAPQTAYRVNMSQRLIAMVGMLVLLLWVSSCSSDTEHATKTFNTVVTGERLFEAYGETKNLTTTVSPPPTARQFILSMDCISPKGSIKITLTGRPKLKAFGEIPCGEKAHKGGPDGSIGIELSKDPKEVPSQVEVAITAPKGGEWSAAVDTRTAQ